MGLMMSDVICVNRPGQHFMLRQKGYGCQNNDLRSRQLSPFCVSLRNKVDADAAARVRPRSSLAVEGSFQIE